MSIQVLRQRLHDRIYGDIVERWRAGQLDDRQFGRAYRFRAQLFVPPIFVIPFVLVAIAVWVGRDIPVAQRLSDIGDFALLFGTCWLAVGAIIDGNARFGVRDMLLRRVRDAAERQQPVVAPAQSHGSTKLEFGSYTRTTRYWNRTLLRVVVINGGIALLTLWIPSVWVFLVMAMLLLPWALIARFDRRPYLEFSADGIWCRAWGAWRVPFSDFKAAYPRQDRMGEEGVVLVPRDPKGFALKLSFEGRLALRSGENVPAHAGTVTIWTSKVGLERDSILSGIQAELSARTQ